jgi:hypothetical protein
MSGKLYTEPWQATADHIAAMLAAAAAPGGALFGVTIESVAPPESFVTPILGWEFRSASDQNIGQNRTQQTYQFEFHLVVQRDFDPTATDAVRQTRLIAEKLWNDRNGNGLGAVLRGDPQLGGTAIDSVVANHQIVIGRDVTDESETSAVIVATLNAYQDYSTF